jgi:hypothetical protein
MRTDVHTSTCIHTYIDMIKPVVGFRGLVTRLKTKGNDKSLGMSRHRLESVFRKQTVHVERNFAARTDLLIP